MIGDTAATPEEEDVVGGVIISTPNGAEGQMVANVLDAQARPVLSGNLHAYVTQVPESGAPVPSLFPARFRAGNLRGNYQVKFELIGGNSFEYTVQVTEP